MVFSEELICRASEAKHGGVFGAMRHNRCYQPLGLGVGVDVGLGFWVGGRFWSNFFG